MIPDEGLAFFSAANPCSGRLYGEILGDLGFLHIVYDELDQHIKLEDQLVCIIAYFERYGL